MLEDAQIVLLRRAGRGWTVRFLRPEEAWYLRAAAARGEVGADLTNRTAHVASDSSFRSMLTSVSCPTATDAAASEKPARQKSL